ncbi:MAG: carboxypeptidase regulatory-like domain-containing protein [Elusimicrobiota bacterium]
MRKKVSLGIFLSLIMFLTGLVITNLYAVEYGIISGTITYSGEKPGDLYVFAFSNWPENGDPFPYMVGTSAYPVFSSPQFYEMSVETGTERWVAAYLDSNGDGNLNEELGEAKGQYEGEVPFLLSTSGRTGIDFLIVDGDVSGKISGNLSYSGSRVGTYTVNITTDPYGYSREDQIEQGSAGAYTTNWVSTGSYYARAWIDEDADQNWDRDEAFGIYQYGVNARKLVPVTDTNTVTGIDITINDPGAMQGNVTINDPSPVGDVFIVFSDTPSFNGGNVADQHFYHTSGSYSQDLPPGDYYIFSWLDKNSNYQKDADEVYEQSGPITVTEGGTAIHDLNLTIPDSSISGAVTYSGAYTGDVIIYANTNGDIYTISYSTTFAYTGTGDYNFKITLSPGENYYIYSFVDRDSNNNYNNINEPFGEYTGNPVYLTASPATGINFTDNDPSADPGDTITGIVNFSSTVVDTSNLGSGIYVSAFLNPNLEGNYDAYVQITSTGQYYMHELTQYTTYYLAAYVDQNYDYISNPSEPKGIYDVNGDGTPDPVYISNQSKANIDISLIQKTSGNGSIGGYINYTGVSSGTVKVQYWRGYISGSPDGSITVGGSELFTVAGSSYTLNDRRYDITGLIEDSYFLETYIDLNSNGSLDAGEPSGKYGNSYAWSIWVPDGGFSDYINMTIKEPFSGKLRGRVAVSTAVAQAVGNVTVRLYEEGSNAVVSSCTSVGTWNNADGHDYNFEFANISVVQNKYYRLQASSAGRMIEPWDVWFTFSDQAVNYLEDRASWADPLKVYPGASLSVDNISIGNGVDVSTYAVTISPDSDGSKDNASIAFDISAVNLADTSYGSAAYRLIIDTNKDGVFSTFDWSQVSWDEQGNPLYDGVKRTWDEMYRIIAENSDWSYQGSVYGDGVHSEEINWEGRDTNWNALPKGTYAVKLQIISKPWWDETETIFDYDNKIAEITIDAVEITGRVTYSLAGSTQTFAVKGARVEAGGMQAWGSAYTDSNGNYKVSGLKAGYYWMGVQAAGFTSAYKENVEVGAAGASNINFIMEKGGKLEGTIKLSGGAFQAYTDRWGYTVDRLYGSVNAWSETGPSYGWSEFVIYAGTDTAKFEMSLAPGEYKLRAEAPDYVSQTLSVTITAQGAVLNISMAKSKKITGLIKLPDGDTAPAGGLRIDASANSFDNRNFGWGGGFIEAGKSSTTFEINSVAVSTYTVRIRCQEFIEKVVNNVIVPSAVSSVNIGEIQFSKGSRIKGELRIEGDTSGMQPFPVGINAYSQSLNAGNGTQVQMSTSAAVSISSYVISGLSAGSYGLNSWMNGFEMENSPLIVSLDGSSDKFQNITLKAYSGKIQGRITGFTDYTKVYVSAVLPWWSSTNSDGQPIKTVINSEGYYELSGLGTGEYIVTANEYDTAPNGWTPGVPTGQYGEAVERVGVANGETTGDINMSLGSGNTIQGLIVKGAGVTYDLSASTIQIMAVPMKFRWYNMEETKFAAAEIVSSNASSATYRISGLADDLYLLQFDGDLNDDDKDEVAGQQTSIYISNGETKTQNIVIKKGYVITGNVERPKTGDDNFTVQLFKADDNSHNAISYAELTFQNYNVSGNYYQNQNKLSLPFSLGPVAPGNYIINVYPSRENYKVAYAAVTVSSSDVKMANIRMSKGATITGTLVDGDTGKLITKDDNIKIRCEARPWVEGGYKEIGNEQNYWNSEWGANPMEISSGTFKLPNLPAGNYFVRLESSGGDSAGDKVYTTVLIAGITVPDTTVDVSIGTVKLYEGVTISGRVTDASGAALANIRMVGIPSSSHGSSVSVNTKTDGKGYYVLRGIDPNIKYWEITAAYRPDWREGIKVEYGDEVIDNVAPKSKDINFILKKADANLEGRVNAPAGKSLVSPFDNDAPMAVILLTKKGKVYKNPMGGIEARTAPDGHFFVQGLVPGKYSLKIMSKGLATAVTDVMLISGETNTTFVTKPIALTEGGKVTGLIRDKEGRKITTSQVEMVVAVQKGTFILAFGSLEVDPSTNEINSYRIEGLKSGVDYYLIMAAAEGSDLRTSTFTVRVNNTNDVITQDLVYTDTPPGFIVQIARDKNNDKKFLLSLFSTEELLESEGNKIITKKAGQASGNLPEAEIYYAKSKDSLTAAYYVGDTGFDFDNKYFVLQIKGHDLAGQETSIELSVKIGMQAKNEGDINPLLGGSVKLGEGDVTSIYIPGGAIATDDVGNVKTIIIKVDASEIGPGGAPKRPACAYPFEIPKLPKGTQVTDKMTPSSTLNNTLQSGYYEIEVWSVSGSALGALLNLGEDSSAKVTIQYDTNTVTSQLLNKLDVAYYNETTGIWQKENSERIIDSKNGTISVTINHLSKFAAFTDVSAPGVPAGLVINSLGANSCKVVWNKVNDSDLAGYKIWRSTISTDAGFTNIALVGKSNADTGEYTDTGLDSKLTYYYKVSAYDDATTPNESAMSESVSWSGAYNGPFIAYIFPSPFNMSVSKTASLRYRVPGDGTKTMKITVKIYNIAGELVRTLMDEVEKNDGIEEIEVWDGANDSGNTVASGVYIYYFKAGDYSQIKKFAVVK